MNKVVEMFLIKLPIFLTLLIFQNENCRFAMADSVESSHACIIGAGYSGLGTARYLKEYGVNFTVFETTRDIGGVWKFNPHVSTEDGSPVYTTIYKDLRTNAPYPIMEYKDFPFPNGTTTFLTGTCFYKYIQSFVKHFDLMKHIQFRSLVTSVTRKGENWILTYKNLDKNKEFKKFCNSVVVATGYYMKPHMPRFEGADRFEGNIIHSVEYKELTPYVNKSVLIVGGGPSAMDITDFLVTVTTKLVHSHHCQLKKNNYPSNYISKPDITTFTRDGVVFKDGTYEEVDDVIVCTGYELDHFYIDDSSQLAISSKYVMPLYLNMVNINHPSMIFIGKIFVLGPRLFDVQAEYAAKLVAKQFQLPDKSQMLKYWLDHVNELYATGSSLYNVQKFTKDEVYPYYQKLHQDAGVAPDPALFQLVQEITADYSPNTCINYFGPERSSNINDYPCPIVL